MRDFAFPIVRIYIYILIPKNLFFLLMQIFKNFSSHRHRRRCRRCRPLHRRVYIYKTLYIIPVSSRALLRELPQYNITREDAHYTDCMLYYIQLYIVDRTHSRALVAHNDCEPHLRALNIFKFCCERGACSRSHACGTSFMRTRTNVLVLLI